MSWWSFKPYVSVAERRAKAARQIKKLEKKGQTISPVQLEGKTIARTFWGKAWCDNLESYSDFANRLPRGRTYVRNGSVCHLQIEPGRVTALVCGSSLYKIKIAIKPIEPKVWGQIARECVGQIGSMIELLQGKLSQHVMQIITRRGSGLFPKPAEIGLNCSCPDWADMCKHVAAALYGVGARLDEKPELLFVLRQVDHLELINQAGDLKALTRGKREEKTIAAGALSDVFGIELEAPTDDDARPRSQAANRPRAATANANAPAPTKRAEGPRGKRRKLTDRDRRRAAGANPVPSHAHGRRPSPRATIAAR